jgi:hypothetical protein
LGTTAPPITGVMLEPPALSTWRGTWRVVLTGPLTVELSDVVVVSISPTGESWSRCRAALVTVVSISFGSGLLLGMAGFGVLASADAGWLKPLSSHMAAAAAPRITNLISHNGRPCERAGRPGCGAEGADGWYAVTDIRNSVR